MFWVTDVMRFMVSYAKLNEASLLVAVRMLPFSSYGESCNCIVGGLNPAYPVHQCE